jgi:hypothetical protein
MLTPRFFAIRFRAHTWVRWIVYGSDCLRSCLFYTTYVLICCIPTTGCFCGLLGQVHVPPGLILPVFFNLIPILALKKLSISLGRVKK